MCWPNFLFVVEIFGSCGHLIIAKYLGQIGFTVIQMAYQIHKKLSGSLLQQSQPHEPSPLTPASDQNNHMLTSRHHYNMSRPWSKRTSSRPWWKNTIHGKQYWELPYKWLHLNWFIIDKCTHILCGFNKYLQANVNQFGRVWPSAPYFSH